MDTHAVFTVNANITFNGKYLSFFPRFTNQTIAFVHTTSLITNTYTLVGMVNSAVFILSNSC